GRLGLLAHHGDLGGAPHAPLLGGAQQAGRERPVQRERDDDGATAHRNAPGYCPCCTLMANLVTPASLAISSTCTTRPCCTSRSALTTRLISGSAVTAAFSLPTISSSLAGASFQVSVPFLSNATVAGLSAMPSVARALGSCTLSVCATMYVEET